MGEIIGLGMTHFPPLVMPDQAMTGFVKAMMKDPALPEHLRTPEGWPEPMRQQWGEDQGLSFSKQHRQALVEGFRKVRRALDDFKPDFCIVWGDDQYENFKEDIIPPFCVQAYDSIELQPWKSGRWGANVWDEPPDKTFSVKGHQAGGKYLATRLLEEGFDVAYSYKPLHDGWGHAFINTVLYLDYDRKGFQHPVVAFSLNCYGRGVISQRGEPMVLSKVLQIEGDEDPPSPIPRRCFDLGAATARALAQSPWRVALIASASWSHCFLVRKNYLLYPDVEADKTMFEALRAGDYDKWRDSTLEDIEDRGHHEVLNWYCLAGAMAELGRKPDEAFFVESWINNSDKVFTVFNP